MLIKQMSQTIQLLNGKVTSGEAFEIIDTLVDDRIRLHKIQMLRKWERNHRFDATSEDEKMASIKEQKTSTKAFIAQAEKEGYHVEITTNIEVKLVKKSIPHAIDLELSKN